MSGPSEEPSGQAKSGKVVDVNEAARAGLLQAMLENIRHGIAQLVIARSPTEKNSDDGACPPAADQLDRTVIARTKGRKLVRHMM